LGCAHRARPTQSDINVAATPSATGPSAPRPCEEGLRDPLEVEIMEGLHVVEVCLRGATPETTGAIREKLVLKRDSSFTADALRRSIEAAYGTGLIDQIEASARQSGTGAVVFFTLQERPKITALAFEGLVALKDDPSVASFPKVGARLRPFDLHAAAQKLRDAYVAHGYRAATVDRVITPDANGAQVKIVVVEGARTP
jgi:outer membrane protein assembly factor BamA